MALATILAKPIVVSPLNLAKIPLILPKCVMSKYELVFPTDQSLWRSLTTLTSENNIIEVKIITVPIRVEPTPIKAMFVTICRVAVNTSMVQTTKNNPIARKTIPGTP